MISFQLESFRFNLNDFHEYFITIQDQHIFDKPDYLISLCALRLQGKNEIQINIGDTQTEKYVTENLFKQLL